MGIGSGPCGWILFVKPLEGSIKLRMLLAQLLGLLEKALGRDGKEFGRIRAAIGVHYCFLPLLDSMAQVLVFLG